MAKIRNGESYLETHLSANDYYCEKESVGGVWVGRGAELLGIEGHSISKKDEAFERLRNNQHPVSGEKLTKRNKTTRLPTFDEARKSLCQKLRLKNNSKELLDGMFANGVDELKEESHKNLKDNSHSKFDDELNIHSKKKEMPSNEEIESHRAQMNPICNRISFFDFQCGCAKSVSIMAIVGGDDRLRTAHEEAVLVGLKELESLAARLVDVLGRKHLQFTGNFAAALFNHDSSRALDPQLHTHCVIANATYDQGTGNWFALSEFEILKAIRYGGKVYQNELAKRVKALGYEIVERRNERGVIEGFEIAGVTKKVMKLFSKRRAVIEKEIENFKVKVGRLPSPAEIAILTKECRESKSLKKIATEEVRAQQVAQLTEEEQKVVFGLKEESLKIIMGVGGEKIDGIVPSISEIKIGEAIADEHRGNKEPKIQVIAEEAEGYEAQKDDFKVKKAISEAKQHIFERSSAIPSHQILAEALNQNLGLLDLERLKGILREDEKFPGPVKNKVESLGLVELVCDPNPLVSLFTSKEHLDHETWAINYVNASAGKRLRLLDKEPVTSEWLAKEQADAVKFVCSSRDAVCAVRGIAGAGKTTMLKELHAQLEKEKYKMLYLAPTASAVKVLQSEGFLNATTVSEYLVKAESEPWHHAVIVVDEAGLQSTKQGYDVLRLAQQGRQRLVLVGDSKQHVSVEAGDFLRLLETHSVMKSNELKEIKRQVNEEYREAIALMAGGRAREALDCFNEMGCIHENGAGYLEAAAKDYLMKSEFGTKVTQVIAVAPTWSENFSFTDGIRQGLKEKGVLKEGVMLEVVDSLQWTKWQREQVSGYKEGLVVTVTRDLGKLKKGAYLVKGVNHVENGHGFGEVLIGGVDGDHRLPLKKSKFFDVGEKRLVEVSEGDRILLRANEKKVGLINGSILTVEKVEGDGSITTREGVMVPSGYRQFTHGYVVTSHKSQGRTAEHVVVAAAKLDEKAAYVSTSRGKISCAIHTPETEALITGASNPSLRLGVFDAKEKVPSLGEIKFGESMKLDETFKVQNTSVAPFDRTLSLGRIHSSHPMGRQTNRVRAFGVKVLEKLPAAFNVAIEAGKHAFSETIRMSIGGPSLNSSNKPHIGIKM